MPAVVAIAVRYLIMAIIQLALWWVIEKIAIPLLNRAVVAIMEAFGVPEETAKDIMANEIIVFAESVGLFAASLKTKMPIKVAEYLGFTTKGFALRKLSPEVESKLSKTAISKTVAKVATEAEVATVAKEVSVAKGLSFARVNEIASFITKVVGVPVGALYMIAQWVDFGNWNSGAYQKTMQKVLAVFGLQPDAKMPQSSVLSKDVWNKVFNAYKEQGAISINDPYKNELVAFTRENLIDLVDKTASAILLDGGSASVKSVIGATIAFIKFKAPDGTTTTGGAGGGGNVGNTGSSSGATTSTSVKVFTGILSSGKIGDGLEFTPRQDDLIENMAEMQQAINNNVAPYLSALLSKFTYDIRVVNSVVVNGVRKYGTTQTIQTGQTKAGAAKMKTVRNKFAVVDIYMIKDSDSRTKLTSIVLGPTNAIAFQPNEQELAGLSANVSKDLITSNTDDISVVASNTPTQNVAPGSTSQTGGNSTGAAGQTPAASAAPVELPPVNIDIGGRAEQYPASAFNDIVGRVKRGEMSLENGASLLTTYRSQGTANIWGLRAAIAAAAGIDVAYKRDYNTGGIPSYSEAQRESVTTQTSSAGATSTGTSSPMRLVLPAAALSASTLSAFYTAMGWAWQNVDERGVKYQELGLGQAAFYTGTAEQNTRLLAALKSR